MNEKVERAAEEADENRLIAERRAKLAAPAPRSGCRARK